MARKDYLVVTRNGGSLVAIEGPFELMRGIERRNEVRDMRGWTAYSDDEQITLERMHLVGDDYRRARRSERLRLVLSGAAVGWIATGLVVEAIARSL